MWIDFLIGSSWVVFAVYCWWYFFLAKTLQPLTLEDLGLTWQVHKRQMGCSGSRINNLLMKHDEVVGFRCECGYEYKQKRLITQKVLARATPCESSKHLVFEGIEIQSEENLG